MEQQYAISAARVEICQSCGNSFTHQGYLDHLFANKECMRRYWEDEEKNHISRLRQRTSRGKAKISGISEQ